MPTQIAFVAEALPKHFFAIVPSQIIAMRAGQIAIELDHSIYDCLYLALAEQESCMLVTADERLCRKMRGTKFSHLVQPLYQAARGS